MFFLINRRNDDERNERNVFDLKEVNILNQSHISPETRENTLFSCVAFSPSVYLFSFYTAIQFNLQTNCQRSMLEEHMLKRLNTHDTFHLRNAVLKYTVYGPLNHSTHVLHLWQEPRTRRRERRLNIVSSPGSQCWYSIFIFKKKIAENLHHISHKKKTFDGPILPLGYPWLIKSSLSFSCKTNKPINCSNKR